MTNLIGRKVNLVGYYPKNFTEKVVGPLTKKIYKITYDYPFKITKVFKNEKKVNLEYISRKNNTVPLNFKPLKNIKFKLLDEEKDDIIRFIFNGNLETLFKKYWYLRKEDIEEFLKEKFRVDDNEKYFEEVENLSKEESLYLFIHLFISMYNLDISFRKMKEKSEDAIFEKLKRKGISFITLHKSGKVKDIYLDKDSKHIFFLFNSEILLIPKIDRKKIQKEMKEQKNYKIQFVQK